jgi:hypothetical protein
MKNNIRALIFSGFVMLAPVLALIQPGLSAYANERQSIRWTPQQDQGSVSSTLSGGRRGRQLASCNAFDDEATRLTLLVPDDGNSLLTTAATPSFSWYLTTSSPVSMEFVLSEPDQAAPIYTQVLQAEASGLTRLSLPADKALEVGKRYRWTVLVSCDSGPEREVYARSFIQRVDGETLAQSISDLSGVDRAVAYASEGIWYDALEHLLAARFQEPSNPQVMEILESLLQQTISDEARTDLTVRL